MVLHPYKYAELLAQKIQKQGANVWLVNTGWIGGGVDVGKRISLQHTRAIINAIHDGSLLEAAYENLSVFDLNVSTNCPEIPSEILNPSHFWQKEEDYWKTANSLARLFKANFQQFETAADRSLAQFGPKVR